MLSPTTPAHLTMYRFRLFPVRSPLLGEWSLFLEVLRCFSSPGAPPGIYGFNPGVLEQNLEGVTPFGNPRLKRLLTAPRGLSQPTTSFFGFWRQGIRRVLLVAVLSGYGRIEILVVSSPRRGRHAILCVCRYTHANCLCVLLFSC